MSSAITAILPSPARYWRRALRVAFGPVTPGWGSWDWVGADIARELADSFETSMFAWGELPECDVAVVVKHLPPAETIERLARQAAVVYAPVDAYGSQAEIAADAPSLRQCSRVVVHCERLRPYFEPYAPVTYMDHHVKFASRGMAAYRGDEERGFILWVGVRSNLPPLVDRVNAHGLELPLIVLTNLEGDMGMERARRKEPGERRKCGHENQQPATDNQQLPPRGEGRHGKEGGRDLERQLGFGMIAEPTRRPTTWVPRGVPTTLSAESGRDLARQVQRQRELTGAARGALDIKGDDFRQRHKPPAKAIDFIASGLPLAMNHSSGTEHLARMGFEIASPEDTRRWFSRAYWEETVAFGRALRELLSLKRVGCRWRRLIQEVAGRRKDEG